MVFRTAGAIATLLLGLGSAGGQALAQYYPAPQAYPPPPQAYPPPGGQPLPVAEADQQQLYDAQGRPVQLYDAQGRPMSPAVIVPQASEPPHNTRFGRGGPADPAEAAVPPPGSAYRDAPPPSRDGGPHQQGYYRDAPPQAPQGYEPAAAGTRPYYGPPGYGAPTPPSPNEQEATRPPLPIGPGQIDPGATGATGGDPRHMAALPPEVRPETGPKKALPPQFRRTLVDYYTKEPAGTLIVDTQNTYLYLVLGKGKALRYGIGVGREGFTWSGTERITKMAEWPDWHPPEEMIERQPYLPRFMAGGDGNPLGARALYLGKTIYRIHGTNQPSTIGSFVSSGCIRLTNEDVLDLYTRVKVGARVVVLPGKPPAPTAAATPPGSAAPAPTGLPAAAQPGSSAAPSAGAAVTAAPLAPPPSAMVR
jgi:lipoprotein-anchoring transpeptidase ErfK/SrfK